MAANLSEIVHLSLGARLAVRGSLKILSQDEVQIEKQLQKTDFAHFLKSVSEHDTLVQEFFEDEEYLDDQYDAQYMNDQFGQSGFVHPEMETQLAEVVDGGASTKHQPAIAHSQLNRIDLTSTDYGLIAEALCPDGLLDLSLTEPAPTVSPSASLQHEPLETDGNGQYHTATTSQDHMAQTATPVGRTSPAQPSNMQPTRMSTMAKMALQWPVIQSADTAIQIALPGQDTESDVVIALKSNRRQLIGERLLQAGLLSSSQISLVLLVDQKLYPEFKFGEILRLRNWLQEVTLDFFINMEKLCDPDFFALPLGERLVRAGLISPADVQAALKLQQDSQPYMRFGEILVKQGLLKQVTVDYFAQLQC